MPTKGSNICEVSRQKLLGTAEAAVISQSPPPSPPPPPPPPFNYGFPREPGLASSPLAFFLQLFGNRTLIKGFTGRLPLTSPNQHYQALKRTQTQSSATKQWYSLVPSFSTSRLLTQQVLPPLHQFSDTSTSWIQRTPKCNILFPTPRRTALQNFTKKPSRMTENAVPLLTRQVRIHGDGTILGH